ncbi:glycosyltransferase family 4 protein [Dyadobacter chenwenxiniae]|uniref:Glycosyltransferase family 4 protein n=1 Tax=Dyadobacter chenwenxiniae TaxID=2906456 RepID=A0A9X1PKE0_9BACT|nr:glycosyltransferase family 4 protein [Dyadobacter chenwenxiniae]MCF0062685.1 glycosyltransferase family 4 protein [Dyadobacter chenwenxiniae]UON83570.1 glycosyltransferase family 4 protein [Dyadobacter chenwenxiniae]
MMQTTISLKNVLHVGPNYIRHKGGMGAVIATYQKHIPGFQFIPSYEGNYNSVLNIPFFALSFLRILWKLFTDRDIKAVHAHGASFGSFYRKYLIFIFSKYIFHKKFVYHLHAAEYHTFYDETNQFAKSLIQHLIKESDCIIVLSESWANFIYDKFQPKKVVVLHNPVEIPSQTKAQSKSDSPITSFLFLGRIGERKGIFDLLDVIVKNRAYYQDKISLTIGGDGEVEKLKNYFKEYQLDHICNYVGWVDGELKQQLLNACDVLILPSYNEGLPIAILEAMSYGKAILSTNVGGIPEVVKDGVNGYVITPGDKLALETNIANLITDKSRLDLMGRQSLKIVSNYDINTVTKRLQNVYDTFIPGTAELQVSKMNTTI